MCQEREWQTQETRRCNRWKDETMAKKEAIKEKYAGRKGPMPRKLKVETPYPKDHKEIKSDEVDYLCNKLDDLSERVNEVELSISDLANKIKRVMDRMGL